jgi:hypothetical protein
MSVGPYFGDAQERALAASRAEADRALMELSTARDELVTQRAETVEVGP